MKKYRLFALDATPHNIETAQKHGYARITARYILVYTQGRKPDGAVQIGEKDISRLSAADTEWLLDCVMQNLERTAREYAPKSLEMLEALERELQKQAEKYHSEGGAEHGEHRENDECSE